jgi:hypothetical protein
MLPASPPRYRIARTERITMPIPFATYVIVDDITAGKLFQIKMKEVQHSVFHTSLDTPVASPLIVSPFTRNTPITRSAMLLVTT